jgi:hypothetical protein
VLGLLLGAPVAPVVLGACTTPPAAPPAPDPLAELASTARSDASFARAVAAAVPSLATAAGLVAEARAAHAEALQREVDRARLPQPPASSSSATPPVVDPASARGRLVDGLRAAEKRIGELIGSVPRFRAGLLGSVAAGCASLREVLG